MGNFLSTFLTKKKKAVNPKERKTVRKGNNKEGNNIVLKGNFPKEKMVKPSEKKKRKTLEKNGITTLENVESIKGKVENKGKSREKENVEKENVEKIENYI